MKTYKIIELLQKGFKPIVKFTHNIYDIESADEGMMGRLISYHSFDSWDDKNMTVNFKIDMSEFVEHNRKIAKAYWKNNNGEACLIWHDTRFYPKNHIEDICEMYIENDEDAEIKLFETVQTSKYFEKYLSDNKNLDYVKYLEDKIKKIEETDHFTNLRMMGLSSDNSIDVSDYIRNMIK
ncbi:MAG: hypothetical protein ACOC2W_04360 [bacterium]